MTGTKNWIIASWNLECIHYYVNVLQGDKKCTSVLLTSHACVYYISVHYGIISFFADNDVTTSKLDQQETNDDKRLVRAQLMKIPLPPSLQNPCSIVNAVENPVWLHLYKYTLTHTDLDTLLTSGSPLNDKHINLAQTLLKKQFPKISGLQSILLQFKALEKRCSNGIQIVHCPNNHWITIFKENSSTNVISVYDSVFDSPNTVVYTVAYNLFNVGDDLSVVMVPMQKQTANSNNCGLFSIAVATALAFNYKPSKLQFLESEMRSHLKACFEEGTMSMYPLCNVNN